MPLCWQPRRWAPDPGSCPRRRGDSSLGTVPLRAASFSPPLGPTPAASRTLAKPGRVSATCSGAGEPWAPAARASVRRSVRPGHMELPASNASCQNGACGLQGTRERRALRAFPSPLLLSLACSPAAAQTGEGWVSMTGLGRGRRAGFWLTYPPSELGS